MFESFPLIRTLLLIFFWFVLSGWAVAIAMLIILPRRQTPEAARAWLLLTFFAPWFGGLLYLLIGETRLAGSRLKKHAKMIELVQTLNQHIRNELTDISSAVPLQQTQLVRLAEQLGYMPALGGNDFELISGYDNIIDRLIADIETAQHHIHLLFYIIADDETGRKVVAALVKAVQRGVTCRVLVDSFGALPFIKKLGDDMIRQGIELHYVLPMGFFRTRFTRIDLRNHRKIAVIDGQLAYTGSQNIVNADYGYDIEGLSYEELMVRLTGPIVLQLQAIFAGDWFIETGEMLRGDDIFHRLTPTGKVVAQSLPSGPAYNQPSFQRMVVALINHAQERVVITTPYFIPGEAFLQAVETAVMRGVEVVLIVSSKVDQALVGYAQNAYYEQLLSAGVRIFIFGRALLHAKHTSVDNNIALIGSGNMDKRSFDLNFEISMLFYDEAVNKALRGEEAKYIEQAQELNQAAWRQRSSKERFLQDTAKLVSPLL